MTSGEPVHIQAAPEFDQGHVTQVEFSNRLEGSLLWTEFAVDLDGSATKASTDGWIGQGNGWAADWDPGLLSDGTYEIRAVAIDAFGRTMSGVRTVVLDRTPIAPIVVEELSNFEAKLSEPSHGITVTVDVTDQEVDEILLKLFGIRWRNERVITPADQDTMGIKTKHGNDVSHQGCGPTAAAACLEWFGDRFPELDQEIRKLARDIAKTAGTDSTGTADDDLASAIKKAIADAGLDPADWNVQVHNDPKKVFGGMVSDFAQKQCDVIPLFRQGSNDDLNGDQVVDSLDVGGHFVTLSSRGTRHIDHHTPSGQHIMGRETYVDFMDPATGQKVEKLLDDTRTPPVLRDYDLHSNPKDSTWLESYTTVCPKNPPPRPLGEQLIATIPVPGPGRYSHTIAPQLLEEGDSFLGIFGRTGNGEEGGLWRLIIELLGGAALGNLAAHRPVLEQLGAHRLRDRLGVGLRRRRHDRQPRSESRSHLQHSGPLHGRASSDQPSRSRRRGEDRLHQVSGATGVPGQEPATRFLSVSPNPFSERTVLRFSLARTGAHRLAVYDVLGRLVKVVSSGALPAGEHLVPWDGRDRMGRLVSAGMYRLRLEAGGERRTRSVLRLD